MGGDTMRESAIEGKPIRLRSREVQGSQVEHTTTLTGTDALLWGKRGPLYLDSRTCEEE